MGSRSSANCKLLAAGVSGLVACLANQAVAAAGPASQEPHAVCDRAEVRVAADAPEVEIVCAALARVLSYFADAGFEIDPQVTISFVDEIRDTPWPDSPHGYFDRARSEIVIARRAVDQWWGLDDREELLGSLHHELGHFAVAAVLGDEFGRLPRAWHEFIAYSVQLALTTAGIREAVLARNPDVPAFETVFQVNDLLTGLLPPQLMALMSYKAYRSWGGKEFLAQLLQFQVPINCMNDLTFPVDQPRCGQ